VAELTHHGMLFVPIGHKYGAEMFVLDEVKGGSPYGSCTMAGDGTRQQTKMEQAFFQGHYTAEIVKQMHESSEWACYRMMYLFAEREEEKRTVLFC